MHSKVCAVGGTQQAATDDTIASPLRGDRLRRWKNQRMLSSILYTMFALHMLMAPRGKRWKSRTWNAGHRNGGCSAYMFQSKKCFNKI